MHVARLIKRTLQLTGHTPNTLPPAPKDHQCMDDMTQMQMQLRGVKESCFVSLPIRAENKPHARKQPLQDSAEVRFYRSLRT